MSHSLFLALLRLFEYLPLLHEAFLRNLVPDVIIILLSLFTDVRHCSGLWQVVRWFTYELSLVGVLWHVGLQNFLCLELSSYIWLKRNSQIAFLIILITVYLYLASRGLIEGIIKDRFEIFKLLIRHLSQSFGVTQRVLLILCPVVLQSCQITL